ncbi:hypothetical protein CUMW_259710 [Citrus unshiu]|nr:hypothetical protein CUMW_259710 [Citrus unshiu]
MGNLIKLHHLKNSNTKSLEEMPVGIGRLTCLQTLCNFVVGNGSGSGLSELKLLMHLRGALEISKLENLESIAERLDNNTSLETIRIFNCGNLKTLPSGLHNLGQLQEIRIQKCRNLESFPEGGLPCAKLTRLTILDCKRLEALPKGLHNLTSLQELTIGGELPSLEEDGLPTNLHSMIERGRGFHRFSSLRQLAIINCDDDMVSFPPKADDKGSGTALPLPASLTSLMINNFPNLERLSSSIVDLQNLTILQLYNCPKLKYFPEKGLPSSLLELDINRCPLIEEKCRKDGGQYWDLLTHIPCVLIDFKSAFGDNVLIKQMRAGPRYKIICNL